MKEIVGELMLLARTRWHTRTGLLSVLILATVLMLMLFAGVSIENVSGPEWGIVGCVLLSIALLWWRTRLPRVKAGHIGVGLAISHEDTPESKRVIADFRSALEAQLIGRTFVYPFQLLLVPPGSVPGLVDAAEARLLADRTGIHLLLFGTLRLRTIDAKRTHVFDLQSLVRHKPIPMEASAVFAKDLRLAVPARVCFLEDNSFVACEASAAQIDVAAKYVLGTASAISGDLPFAEQLLVDAEKHLKEIGAGEPSGGLSTLLSRVQASLLATYEVWLHWNTDRYVYGGQLAALKEAEDLLPKLRRLQPHNYAAKLMAAMCAFVLRRDLRTAELEIASCKQETDGAWLYSRAFIEAYEADLDAAYRSYTRAFESPIAVAATVTQCEEFIERVVESEPEKYWLYYALGFINYRGKGDLDAAENDLNRFLTAVEPNKFPGAQKSAQKWLSEIAHKRRLAAQT